MIASGAYLMAINCNLIIASGGLSKVGSIGSYVSLNKIIKEFYSEIFEDVYAQNNRLKRMRNFGICVGWKYRKYQQMANESAQYFIDAVKLKRPLSAKKF